MAPSPYFCITNVHLEDINMFAKFYEIPSLPFHDIEKPKHRRRTNGQCENSTPRHTHKHSLQGGGSMKKEKVTMISITVKVQTLLNYTDKTINVT